MQFVKDGPQIPGELLQKHEEGNVIFFCGAGISYSAGLFGFEELVTNIYHHLGVHWEPEEKQAFDRGQYDTTLGLLERRYPGQRGAVRRALYSLLQPKYRKKGALVSHEAILKLATGRDSKVRLVTTNFDRIFQKIINRNKQTTPTYQAPLLPIPKDSRWDGVVHLHGLLPESPVSGDLNRLVLSSGDFGLAYLTERWASRFVSELFRNYTVCFVGYSINDPVLRYMMDALAADRILGENTPKAYALADYETGEDESKLSEWKAKGVIPILYEVKRDGKGRQDHSSLYRTVSSWADTYQFGSQGKEAIVSQYAATQPLTSTTQDDYVGRMLWALSDKSGIPAKHFAEFEPTPSIAWLSPIESTHYKHSDLPRFGIPIYKEHSEELKFSLIRRPAPYGNAPWMNLLSDRYSHVKLDPVMFQLSRWLTKQLNNPSLILWVVNNGGILHEEFSALIRRELNNLSMLEKNKDTEKLTSITDKSPYAIPSREARALWDIILSGRLKSSMTTYDLYSWIESLKLDGLTTTARMNLRDLLSPKIEIRRSYRSLDSTKGSSVSLDVNQLFDFKLELNTDNALSIIQSFKDSPEWQEALPKLLNDVQQLLSDALELMGSLGQVDDRSDHSHWPLPSISDHWQNRGHENWVVLIELLRDSWLSIYSSSPDQALQIANTWYSTPYPTFKRLAFFAYSHFGASASELWVTNLLQDNSYWLWTNETKREVIRLLVIQGSNIPRHNLDQLETAIISGPPREMFRDDLDSEDWRSVSDHYTWLLLAKLELGGCPLSNRATRKLSTLISKNPSLRLQEDESDEFTHWLSGTGDPDFIDTTEFEHVPRKKTQLLEWLLKPQPSGGRPIDNDWRELCEEKQSVATCALYRLALIDEWPVQHWIRALQAWSSENLARRSWRYLAPLVEIMPDYVLSEISSSLTWWLEVVSKVIQNHNELFIPICSRQIWLNGGTEADGQITVNKAINHPIGHITNGLINYWFREIQNDNQGLPEELKSIFRRLCDTEQHKFRYARTLLSANLITFFRIDQDWTQENLLPLLNWDNSSDEALACLLYTYEAATERNKIDLSGHMQA